MWTEERVAVVRTMADQGYSAQQIADHFGGVSRNAVVGIGFRNKIKFHGQAGNMTRNGQPRPKPKPKPRVFKPKATIPFKEPKTPIPDPSKPIGIMELTAETSRWPIGDPSKDDFGFCGHQSIDGLPYCQSHCRISYQPREERRHAR